MKLEKYGEFYLNPEQITEIEVIKGRAMIYLADGRKRSVFAHEINNVLSENKIPLKQTSKGDEGA
jgi:hypothetical protein